MSNALAIAVVTSVLRDLLKDGLLKEGLLQQDVSAMLGSAIEVSLLPPDRVVAGDGTEVSQLNLFLRQVTPNLGWRNEGLPSRDDSGRQRLSNPPLALNLHYLLTAYSGGDLHAEVLLGCAMQVLHEVPVLTRGAIQAALKPAVPPGSVLERALVDSGLEQQIEMIKITPESLSTEEMSNLWNATQSHFRPSAAYVASVVLIVSSEPARSSLPVLTRGRRLAGPVPGSEREEGVIVIPGLVPPYPTLESVLADAHKTPSTLQLGDGLTVRGHHLAGTARAIVLRNDRFQVEREIPLPDSSDETSFEFTVPKLSAVLPVGYYQLQLRVRRAGETDPRVSNALPVALAPAITTFPPIAMTRGVVDSVPNVLSLRIGCEPELRVGQVATLQMGTREAPARPFTDHSGTLDFAFADAPPAGSTPLLRLKVDGIESIVVNRQAEPPTFFDHRITLPA